MGEREFWNPVIGYIRARETCYRIRGDSDGRCAVIRLGLLALIRPERRELAGRASESGNVAPLISIET